MNENKPDLASKYSKNYFRFSANAPPGGGSHGQVT
jgi:hypothetical protein